MRHLTRRHLRSAFPKRPSSAHKGDCGRVLIIAGSRGMVGASVLSANAAMRMGAGLVRLVTVKSQQPIAARRSLLEVTTTGIAETKEGTLSKSAWPALKKIIQSFKPTVIAAGPGLGISPSSRILVQNLLTKTTVPLVLDADGLRALKRKRRAPFVYTPHPGEMARLLNTTTKAVQLDRLAFVKRAVKKFGGVCVLKGQGTLVSDGSSLWKNNTGNAGLASGGTGDVLTGVIASLWGQMKNPTGLLPAALGVLMHGAAADVVAKKLTMNAMVASDLISSFPYILRRMGAKS